MHKTPHLNLAYRFIEDKLGVETTSLAAALEAARLRQSESITK